MNLIKYERPELLVVEARPEIGFANTGGGDAGEMSGNNINRKSLDLNLID